MVRYAPRFVVDSDGHETFVRAAAVDIAVAIALQRAVDAAGRVPGTFFDALKRAFDGAVMEPAARFLAELDATCRVRGFVRSN